MEETYPLSAEIHKKSRKYGMKDPRYLAYADLRFLGWSMKDAWNVALSGTGANWSKSTLEAEMNRLESLESVGKRIKELQEGGRGKYELTPEELSEETSKERILTELVIAKKKYRYGSPEWMKAVSLIADYNKIKQDDIQTEDTTVHHYLPARYPTSHRDCLLYLNGMCRPPVQDEDP